MLIINKPYVIDYDEQARLVCDISIDDEIKKIYIEVDKEYKQYLCYERCDAFLIVLFYYAMRYNHDIICNGLVTEDLYYQITEYLIPILKETSHNTLSDIKIMCLTAPNLENVGAVGTSVTCGVDSFHSIFNSIDNKIKSRKLTHLTMMNIADSYKKEGNYNYIMDKIYSNSDRVSKQLGLPLIKMKSNMREIFPIPPMHTLIRMFGVYSLQKLFGTYYFSSGYPIWTFNMENSSVIDSARYDLLLCKELSTRNLTIYSEGSQKNRLEKLEYISQFDIVKKNLHVCVSKEYNCGVCSKCVRTILGLDVLNKLEEFKDIFNIDYYHKNQDFYFNEAVRLYNEGDLYVFDYIDKLKEKYPNSILNKIPDNHNLCERCYKMSDYKLSERSKKKMIGVFVGSSSGKSTVVKNLKKNMENAYILDVDKYMIKYLDIYKQQIIEKLDIPDDGNHWCNYIYNNKDDVRTWISIIKKDVERCIMKEINSVPNRIIIIDSFMLPYLDIYKECCHVINVKSDINVNLPRVKQRLEQVGRVHLFSDESLIKRLLNTDFSDSTANYDFIINNDKDIDYLNNNCDKVLKIIKSKPIKI